MSSDNEKVPDDVKASVIDSGALASFKNISHPDSTNKPDDRLHDLQRQAQDMIDDIRQKLNSGKLDESTSVKLSGLLQKLQGALHKSPAALAAALAEAEAIADSGGSGMSTQQKTEQLWQRVEADNKVINDDFEKMREAGVVFNDKLWNRHKELMEYIQRHPHDLKTQKELDAVDDALLIQAQPQLSQNPNAQQSYNDAKKKSDDRHLAVDKDLAGIDKRIAATSAAKSAFDDEPQASNNELTLNEVAVQSGLPETKNNSQKLVRKQTNVYI